MHSSFGARLRAQREQQQIRLADIADQTKIRLTLLDGLERDDVRHWPSGIFRRSYVRAYAQAIGMEPDVVVREFLELYPDPGEDLAEALGDQSSSPASGRPPTRFRFLLGSAIGALPGRRAPQEHAPPGVAPPGVGVEQRLSFVPQADTADDRAQAAALAADHAHPVPPPAIVAASAADTAEVTPAAAASLPLPIDLSAVADLCSGVACAQHADDLAAILATAVTLVPAAGLIVWIWDPRSGVLRPVLNQGFPEQVLSQLRGVAPDSNNALAASFRSGTPRVVPGSASETGALVVPLLTPSGCAGVLALELRDGREHDAHVTAIARILAAQISMLVGYPTPATATG